MTIESITPQLITPQSIIDFWYSDIIKKKWFVSTKDFDQEIKDIYENIWLALFRCEGISWQDSAVGCLATVIVLDQFPLNMFRGEVKSFSSGGIAVKIVKHAVSKDFDKEIDKYRVSFLYMPLMHSENMDDQYLSVQLFEQAGLSENLRFAKHHCSIIERFGRFPHRNKILQRDSSPDELIYLESKNAFTGSS